MRWLRAHTSSNSVAISRLPEVDFESTRKMSTLKSARPTQIHLIMLLIYLIMLLLFLGASGFSHNFEHCPRYKGMGPRS